MGKTINDIYLITKYTNSHLVRYFPILIFISQVYLFPQGWEWQNPLPQGNRLDKIQFIDSLHGWISTHSGTLLRTTDGGNKWDEQIIGKLWVQKVFFIDTLNGWCVGYGTPPFILRTKDGGKTWEDLPIPDELNSGNSYNLWDVYFLDTSNGYFSSSSGKAFHTSDGGIKWENILFHKPPYDIRSIYFIDSLKGFVIGDTPLLKTTNGGESWVQDSSFLSIDGMERKILFMDSLYGWIMKYDKVYRTTNGGINWNGYSVDSSITGDDRLTDMVFIDYQNGWVCSRKGLYKTVDSGKTWTNINPNKIFNGIYFCNDKEGWAVGRDKYPEIFNVENKYYHTSDGGLTWTTDYHSVTDQLLYGLDFIDDNFGWAVGTGGEIIHTEDGGKNWGKQNSNATEWLRNVEFWDTEIGWIVGFEGITLRTTNGGIQWDRYNVNSDYYLEESCFINPRVGWIAGWSWNADSGVVLKTINGGLNWINLTPPNIGRLFGVYFIDSLKGWIASGGGTIYDKGEVYHTTDGGTTWTLQISESIVRFKEILFIDSLTGWIAADNSLLKTTDGGDNWVYKRVFEELDYIWSFTFCDEKHGWANGLQGQFSYTTDGGENWISVAPRTAFTMFDIDFTNQTNGWSVGDFGIILYTKSGGITSVFEEQISNELPNNFELKQNYPNPFNSSTTISYYLHKDGFTILKVYNILGEEVKTLTNNFQFKGMHHINLNGEGIPSGIYIYALSFDGGLISHKMLLLK